MKIGILPMQPAAIDLGERMMDHVSKRYGPAQLVVMDQSTAGMPAKMEECTVILVPIAAQWGAMLATNQALHAALVSALAHEKLLIPILLAGASMPTETELPPDVAAFHRRQAYTLRSDPYFAQDIARLFQQLDAKLRWRPANMPILVGALLALLSYGVLAGGLFVNHLTVGQLPTIATPLPFFAAAVVLIASYGFTLGFVLYRAAQRHRWVWLVASVAVFLAYFTQSGNDIGYHVFPFTVLFYGFFGVFGPRREIA